MKRNTRVVALFVLAAACSNQDGQRAAEESRAQAIEPNARTVSAVPAADAPHIKVYKDPNCGCCKAWIQHLEQNGFVVEVMDMPDLS